MEYLNRHLKKEKCGGRNNKNSRINLKKRGKQGHLKKLPCPQAQRKGLESMLNEEMEARSYERQHADS